MSKIVFRCQNCNLNIKGQLTEKGCPRCKSKAIRKQEGSDREWLNWYYKKVKGRK